MLGPENHFGPSRSMKMTVPGVFPIQIQFIKLWKLCFFMLPGSWLCSGRIVQYKSKVRVRMKIYKICDKMNYEHTIFGDGFGILLRSLWRIFIVCRCFLTVFSAKYSQHHAITTIISKLRWFVISCHTLLIKDTLY